jgi:hypothetical protein
LSSIIRLIFVFFLLSKLPVLDAQELPAGSPTGILVDRSLPLAHLDSMDGSASAPAVNLARWRQGVFELRNSSEIDLPWQEPREMARKVRDKRSVALALLHARYDRLSEDGSTYRSEVFAFTPLKPRNYNGGELRFTLDPENIFKHASAEITGFRFDADDGRGLRPLLAGQPLEVSYSSTGIKILELQAVLADGRTLSARSPLNVVQLLTPDPTATWSITASESWGGSAGTGQAYIYLAEQHSELTRPVVIIEGFDIDNSIDWPVLYDLLNRENLLENLRAAGYDAVVLDFTEAIDPIQRNAFVLTELLDRVNETKPPEQLSVLIGASMGGLIGRYGLLWMEQENITHHVRSFLSFDTPHQGANIPLGIQEWVSFFASESEEAAYLEERLGAPASRQMLLYHHESTLGSSAAPDPMLAALNSELSGMGAWPQMPRLVAIANGSGSMVDQGFDPGEQVILYEYRGLLADIDGDVWAVPDGGSNMIFDGLIDPLIGSTASNQVTVDGTLPWDNSPGGARNSMQQLADATAPFGDIIALHNDHNFIPTISALALSTNDPFYDIAGDGNLLGLTEFDQVYFPADNQEHIDINAQNKAWFLAEIQLGIEVSTISGDTSEDGDTATFTIAATIPPSSPVSIPLSSSNPSEGTVPAVVVLPAGSTAAQVVTVTGVDDESPDGNVTYTILTAAATSEDNAYDGIDPADVEVMNVDNESDEIFRDGFESLP